MAKRQWIIAAALAVAGTAIGTSAAANTTIGVQIGVPVPVYAQPVYPQPVYAQPVYAQPVYPQPIYGQPVYVRPAPVAVYETRPAVRVWAPGHAPARVAWQQDRDGDGVPNRWDRAPRNPYRY